MVVDPAFARTDEPVERIFAILAGYRERILQTNCKYGCPLGRLALEIDPENRPAHKLIAENFKGWITAVRARRDQINPRLHQRHRPRRPRNLRPSRHRRRRHDLALLRHRPPVRPTPT